MLRSYASKNVCTRLQMTAPHPEMVASGKEITKTLEAQSSRVLSGRFRQLPPLPLSVHVPAKRIVPPVPLNSLATRSNSEQVGLIVYSSTMSYAFGGGFGRLEAVSPKTAKPRLTPATSSSVCYQGRIHITPSLGEYSCISTS